MFQGDRPPWSYVRVYGGHPSIWPLPLPTVVSVVGVAGVVSVAALQSSIGRVKTNSYLKRCFHSEMKSDVS